MTIWCATWKDRTGVLRAFWAVKRKEACDVAAEMREFGAEVASHEVGRSKEALVELLNSWWKEGRE